MSANVSRCRPSGGVAARRGVADHRWVISDDDLLPHYCTVCAAFETARKNADFNAMAMIVGYAFPMPPDEAHATIALHCG